MSQQVNKQDKQTKTNKVTTCFKLHIYSFFVTISENMGSQHIKLIKNQQFCLFLLWICLFVCFSVANIPHSISCMFLAMAFCPVLPGFAMGPQILYYE